MYSRYSFPDGFRGKGQAYNSRIEAGLFHFLIIRFLMVFRAKCQV